MAKTQPSLGAFRQFGNAAVGLGLDIVSTLLSAEERMQYNAGVEAIDRGITNFDSLLKQDPNWQSYTDKAAKAEEEIWENLEPEITNVGAKNNLYAYMQKKRSQHLSNISDYQTQQRIAEALGNLNATTSSIMSDPVTPADIRKQKISTLLSDAYVTNLIDNPTRGAKEEELFHKIDLQTVAGETWKVFSAGGDYQTYLDDPANQMGLQATEIDKIGDAIWGRVQQEENRRALGERNNNRPIDEALGVAFQAFISGKGTKENPPMDWDMLTKARGGLIGTTGNDIHEKWVMRFKQVLDGGTSGDANDPPDLKLAAPFLSVIHDPNLSAYAKGNIISKAYTAGKLGKVGSVSAVKTNEYLFDNFSQNSTVLSTYMDLALTLARPDPITGAAALITPGTAVTIQGMLQNLIRLKPLTTDLEIGAAFDQAYSMYIDKAIKTRTDEIWKTEGASPLGIGPIGGGKPAMADIADFTARLQAGEFSSLEDTAKFKMTLDTVKATQEEDLSSRLKAPRNGVLFKIDPSKTTKSKYGTPYFYDQFGNQYFYERLDSENPAKWNWYFRRLTTRRSGQRMLEDPEVLK